MSTALESGAVFLVQTVGAAVPLALATSGGVLSERAGVATIALEGYLLAGAFGAATCALATHSMLIALVASACAGALCAGLFAFTTVTLRANAIVAGVALNMLCAGGTRAALKVLYDSASNSPPLPVSAARDGSVASVAVRSLASMPTTWCAIAAVLFVSVLLSRTVFGLRATAAGEHPEALRAQGVSVERVRVGALVLGGALAGLGGAHLSLAQHEFVAYMSNGRGFLALAAVILGRWRPVPAAGAALFVGALSALQAVLAGPAGKYAVLLQALPFVVTLAAVVGVVGRTRPPAALSQ